MEYNNNPYENCEMLSINGDFLAYTDLKRMNWYVDRDLANKIDDKKLELEIAKEANIRIKEERLLKSYEITSNIKY